MDKVLDRLISLFNIKAENILVVDDDKVENEQKTAAIYFSSLAIIPLPRDANSFAETILKKDCYEWFGTRVKSASRHIFVRDLELVWYQHGISAKYDSIDKVAEQLKLLTEGYSTICVGSSAGGYAAMLFAKLIDAQACFAFSPCIDVNRFIQGNRTNDANSVCWQEKYDALLKDPGKYNNLMEIYRGNTMPVYAYFPILSQLDSVELKDAWQIPAMKLLLHKNHRHVHTFSRNTVERLINTTISDALYGNKQSELYNATEIDDYGIASKLQVPIEEVAPARKNLKYKMRKYKAKNIFEYLFVSSIYKLTAALVKILNRRGLRIAAGLSCATTSSSLNAERR